MNKHARLLGAILVVWGLIWSFGMLIFLMLVVIGGGFAMFEDTAVGLVVSGIGLVFVLFFAVISIPTIFAGYGLLRNRSWARTLAMVMCIIHLVDLPIGTGIGLYGLWALTQPDPIAFRPPTEG